MAFATHTTRVLLLNSSGRRDGSITRTLGNELVSELEARLGRIEVIERDLDRRIPPVDAAWIDANFTDEPGRSAEQRKALALSDELVAELVRADIVIIGAPIYNFGVPSTLKAWIDMIARARVTFRYTDKGPVGLLEGKRAFLVVASGGVPVDSDVDFATPYLRQALRFVGIDDIEVIAADRLNTRGQSAVDDARTRIAELVHINGATGAPRVNSQQEVSQHG